MFTLKGCVVIFTCVVATQATSWRAFGYHDDSCGLESEESLCDTTLDADKPCEPLVVRPQEVPKPSILKPLTPIPGPCACKKAIVKPAILPKPVCKPTYHKYGGEHLYGVCATCGSSDIHDCHHVTSTHRCYGDKILSHHPGVWAPADAVSIAIAQKKAQHYCNLDEDRLSFGFRKIPIEIPKQRIIRQNNIPEEKIFSLNGQIVELKPVKVCCPGKSIDEQATEDLLALEEEEETDSASVGEDDACSPIRRISLGQLGYVPSKGQKKTFVDVPESEDTAVTTSESEESSSSSASESSSGYKAGKVVYKTVTKPATLTIASEDTADCDSSEGEQTVVYEEKHKHKGHKPHRCGIIPCTCGCPECYHSTSSASSSSSSKTKKASLIIQKLCSN